VNKNGAQVWTLESAGEEQTQAAGRRLALRLPPQTVIGLIGPLGAGKTCMARGVAEAHGVDPRQVTSPTFVYLVEYQGWEGVVQHADLYRFADLDEEKRERALAEIGLADALGDECVTVVEWWDYYVGSLPPRLATVEFVPGKADHRLIHFSFHGLDAAAVAAAVGARSGRE